jgi:hypothetical protein
MKSISIIGIFVVAVIAAAYGVYVLGKLCGANER